MFEKPQKAQAVRIMIEAVSLDSTSMAPSLEEPLLGRGCGYPWMPIAVDEKYSEIGEGLQCGASAHRRSSPNNGRSAMRSTAVVSDYLALGVIANQELTRLARRNVAAHWSRASHDSKTAINEFAILYQDCFKDCFTRPQA